MLGDVDRLAELDPPARRQRDQPERPEPGEGRRDRHERRADRPRQRRALGDLRIDLLRADDRDRDDRRAGPQRDLDEAAAAEALQPVALGERLAGSLDALGEDHHQLVLARAAGSRCGGSPARRRTRRMKLERNGSTKAQSRTMNRGQRGSGCSFMIAIVIIVASNGNSDAGVVGDEQRPAVRRDVARRPSASTRHQTLVEELEEREDRLGELLVEAPLVLVVLAPQPAARSARARRAAGSGSDAGGPLGGGERVEARPRPRRAALRRKSATRLGRERRLARALVAQAADPGEPAGERRRGAARGRSAGPRSSRAKSRIAADGVVARLEADLLAQPAVVDAAPVAQQPHAVAEQPAGAEPVAEPPQRGPNSGCGIGDARAGRSSRSDAAQRDRAARARR